MNTFRFAAFLATLIFACSLGAREAPQPNVEQYLTYLDELRAGFSQEKPKPLSPSEWKVFDKSEQAIRRATAGKTDFNELSARELTQVVNARRDIVALIEGTADERMVCRRESRVGTRIQRTTCISRAQYEAERQAAQDMVLRFPHPDPQPDLVR